MQRFTGFLKRWSELLLVFVLLFCGCSVRPATAAAAGAATVAAAATAAGAERKNYGIEYHRYVLDFEDAGALENSEGWKFSNAGQATAADGSLTVQGNGFAIRSAEILGDAYGAEDTQLTFDMTLTDGQVSVGVRLKSTVSANDTGIWFTIGPDTVAVRGFRAN